MTNSNTVYYSCMFHVTIVLCFVMISIFDIIRVSRESKIPGGEKEVFPMKVQAWWWVVVRNLLISVMLGETRRPKDY